MRVGDGVLLQPQNIDDQGLRFATPALPPNRTSSSGALRKAACLSVGLHIRGRLLGGDYDGIEAQRLAFFVG